MYIIYIFIPACRDLDNSANARLFIQAKRDIAKREEALLAVRWARPSDGAVSPHINRPLSAQVLAGCPLRESVEGFAVDFLLEI